MTYHLDLELEPIMMVLAEQSAEAPAPGRGDLAGGPRQGHRRPCPHGHPGPRLPLAGARCRTSPRHLTAPSSN